MINFKETFDDTLAELMPKVQVFVERLDGEIINIIIFNNGYFWYAHITYNENF